MFHFLHLSHTIQHRRIYAVSCAPNPNECGGGGGCTGATAEIAYDFVSNYGILEEWRFGYQSFRGKVPNCTIMPPPPSSLSVDSNNLVLRGGAGTLSMEVLDDEGNKNDVNDHIAGAVASIVGFSKLPSNHYESLMVSVATMGPVVVLVAASGWGLYKGGIYDDSNSTTTRDINHAVVLEGYGTDEETDQDYWLVRNSWVGIIHAFVSMFHHSTMHRAQNSFLPILHSFVFFCVTTQGPLWGTYTCYLSHAVLLRIICIFF